MSQQLAPCPPLMNCVCSSGGASRRHRIEPIKIEGEPAEFFRKIKMLLETTARTELLVATDTYIHAVCRTRVGFIDDLEVSLSACQRVAHVRSASRFGYYDLGANRRRVEAIRLQLREKSS